VELAHAFRGEVVEGVAGGVHAVEEFPAAVEAGAVFGVEEEGEVAVFEVEGEGGGVGGEATFPL
jgi:hypothetical protein